jgi:hypothetical protein
MAVSVPPPLFQLSNVVKFRDDGKPTPTATATTAPTTIKSTKNKRKSMEPKKLASPKNETAFPAKRPKLQQCGDGSDGEQTHSPGSTTSSSSDGHSSASSDRITLSPQCQMLAPKKRFKQVSILLSCFSLSLTRHVSKLERLSVGLIFVTKARSLSV